MDLKVTIPILNFTPKFFEKSLTGGEIMEEVGTPNTQYRALAQQSSWPAVTPNLTFFEYDRVCLPGVLTVSNMPPTGGLECVGRTSGSQPIPCP
jgi:hypothetical protein